MARLADQPLFVSEYPSRTDLPLPPGAVYLHGEGVEDRATVPAGEHHPEGQYVRIVEGERRDIWLADSPGTIVQLRNRDGLEGLLAGVGTDDVFLDITGLTHDVWVPLVRVALESGVRLRVVYLEPRAYAPHPTPRPGEAFDLSDVILGIAPLPLFSVLTEEPPENTTFIPLLGFEGNRFKHMLFEVEPQQSKIFPILGVPGFQIEYPFFAYLGNAEPLGQSRAYRQVRFAKSNCPFSAYYVMSEIINRDPDDHYKVGLIGTKPHAVAAVMHAMRNDVSVELLYDHAKRKQGRSYGVARCLVYDLAGFYELQAKP
jgi:hypothetical protein